MDATRVARDFVTLKRDRPGLFDEMAAAVFAFQRARNHVYRRYCEALDGTLGEVPFLPADAFKHGPVTCFPPEEAEHVFESSGTGQGTPGRHYVKELAIYERSFFTNFELEFGSGPFILSAHLPRYADRGRRSSLLYMVEGMMRRHAGGGFFLEDPGPLHTAIERSAAERRRLILFGAAFGLIDLVERSPILLPPDALVVETGGMKTHRREIERQALHEQLAAGFGVPREQVRSEYGMCELLSQCYTRGSTVFYPPPWMAFAVIDANEPARECDEGETGVLALFDLANVYSASAILTQDRAVRRGDGFEVLGRLSGAELRGCNFLLEHA